MLPNAKLFDEMASKFSELIANSPARDLEKNAKAFFGSALARLDLVTREEFELQRELLIRTRERLEQLEARIAELEASAKPRN